MLQCSCLRSPVPKKCLPKNSYRFSAMAQQLPKRCKLVSSSSPQSGHRGSSILLNKVRCRFNFCWNIVGIIKWLLGNRSGSWMSFLTRQTLEDATSYQQAKHLLTNTTLLAPAYFILAGTKSHEVV